MQGRRGVCARAGFGGVVRPGDDAHDHREGDVDWVGMKTQIKQTLRATVRKQTHRGQKRMYYALVAHNSKMGTFTQTYAAFPESTDNPVCSIAFEVS